MVLMKISVYNTHYYPGSSVCGEVFVKMDKPQKCENIVISLLGRADVRWVKQEQIGNVRRKTTYTNGATYVDDQAVVWTKAGNPSDELEAGEHHFPFQFQLPPNCPPSFEGRFGHVRYEFEARLTPSNWRKFIGGHTTKTALYVEGRAEILRLYRAPETAETIKSVGFSCINLGSITCAVTLPCTGFSAGQSIPISANINNQTSRRLRIQASLERQDIFFSSGHQKVVETRLARVLGPRVPAREAASFEDINLVIPCGLYPTIKTCSCISVEYVVAVKIKIPWSINRTVRIPVVIANEQPADHEVVQFGLHPEQDEHDNYLLGVDSQESQGLLH